MKHQFEYHALLFEDIDHAVFLSQGRFNAETYDSRHFLDLNWLSKLVQLRE